MYIEPNMRLSDLIERMYGDFVFDPDIAEREALAMRDMLNQRASAYGWTDTLDVSEADWIGMLETAVLRIDDEGKL